MMNLISIRYHKIVDFESLFFVFVKIPGKANREDIHPVKSSSKRHRFKPFEFRVKTANNLYCIVLSTYIPIQFAMPTPKSFALWRILQNVSRSFRRSSPTFHFWARCLASCEVELGLTGPTSISTNIRTTCIKSLAVFVSNDSSLSVRPRILSIRTRKSRNDVHFP